MSVAISSAGGTGAAAIEKAYVNMFKDGFSQAFQQFDTVFAPYFQMERQDSEFAYYDRIGHAEDMTEDNVRYADNPVSEIPHDRRRSQLKDYHLGKYIEPKDMYRILSDPTNEYQVALRASGNRKIDDIVRDNIFGTAYAGKKGEQAVTFVPTSRANISVGEISSGHSNPITTTGKYVLSAGDVEGFDIGDQYRITGTGSATGLTLDKLKAVRYLMLRLDAIAQNEVINVWIGSHQFQDLLGIDEVINSDYSVRKSLAEGSVTTFMGFRFMHNERLNVNSDGSRECIVATPRSLKVCVAKNLEIDTWRDTGKRNIPYIYMKLSMDAVRMWGEITGRLNCYEG